MTRYGAYLVCHEHLEKVRDFLGKFYKEDSGIYNFNDWITFTTSGNFIINLMRGLDQPLTQNMTFEIYCESLSELEALAKKRRTKVRSFRTTGAPQAYRYYYIEVCGPNSICKIEFNYTEDIE